MNEEKVFGPGNKPSATWGLSTREFFTALASTLTAIPEKLGVQWGWAVSESNTFRTLVVPEQCRDLVLRHIVRELAPASVAAAIWLSEYSGSPLSYSPAGRPISSAADLNHPVSIAVLCLNIDGGRFVTVPSLLSKLRDLKVKYLFCDREVWVEKSSLKSIQEAVTTGELFCISKESQDSTL